MQSTYSINADELNEAFISKIRANYKGKKLEIVVFEEDETAYLNSSEIMRTRIEESRGRDNGLFLNNFHIV